MKTSFTKKQRYITLVSVVILIVIWKLLSLYYHSDSILPSPEKTVWTAINLICTKDFFEVVGITILRGLIGFIIAGIAGVALGIWAGNKPGFYAFISPLIVVIRSTPVIAITLLALIWFTPDYLPVFIGLLTMFPLVFTNVYDGMKSIDSSLVEMAKFYKVSNKRIIREIYIPAITPFIISGISNAVGIGWRAIIIGEVLGQPKYGIGTQMQNAQTFLKVDVLIAWTFVVIILSYLFELLVRWVERKFVTWKS